MTALLQSDDMIHVSHNVSYSAIKSCVLFRLAVMSCLMLAVMSHYVMSSSVVLSHCVIFHVGGCVMLCFVSCQATVMSHCV